MLFLMLGIFCTALFITAISVYIFHDVDQDKIGHWTEAFTSLCAESVLFTLMIGGSVWLLTLLGRHLFHLREHSPRAMLGLFLGIGVTMCQYPWEFSARRLFPKLAESALLFYLVVAIVLCTVVLLRDNFKQMKLRKALEAEWPSV
jgi:hypothetical protein